MAIEDIERVDRHIAGCVDLVAGDPERIHNRNVLSASPARLHICQWLARGKMPCIECHAGTTSDLQSRSGQSLAGTQMKLRLALDRAEVNTVPR